MVWSRRERKSSASEGSRDSEGGTQAGPGRGLAGLKSRGTAEGWKGSAPPASGGDRAGGPGGGGGGGPGGGQKRSP